VQRWPELRTSTDASEARASETVLGVEDFRPLSSRGKDDPQFDVLHAGLPDHLKDPIRIWVERFLWVRPPMESPYPDTGLMMEIQAALQVRLDWSFSTEQAVEDLLRRMEEDDTFAIDVLDFLLHEKAREPWADEMNEMLARGRSEWEVTESPEGAPGNWRLTKRGLGPVMESIEETHDYSQRAHVLLMRAWGKLAGLRPDPSSAYGDAVRAVEVVMRPVVTPDDSQATLGKMISALRDKPEKWDVVLDGATVEDIANMANMIWRSQLDRHGTDDESVPLSVSHEEGDAAVHVAIALVRLFGANLVRRVE
jgi:hypothetical protein